VGCGQGVFELANLVTVSPALSPASWVVRVRMTLLG
jgi:hypothetical protein